jgi:hypothetical protein
MPASPRKKSVPELEEELRRLKEKEKVYWHLTRKVKEL